MIAACIGIAWNAVPAVAIGYYNLPGNFCQWCGYGNGAGYHSCLVLGPSTCDGVCNPNEVRLACPPQPPGYGCCYCESGYGELPRYIAPAPQPGESLYAPTPAAMRSQILR